VGVIVAISYLIKIALPVKGWKECSYRRQQSRFKLWNAEGGSRRSYRGAHWSLAWKGPRVWLTYAGHRPNLL